MPVLFRHLPKDELGIWLLLGQSWAVMGILDLGFGVTLTRRIALAKGKSGGAPNAALSEESLSEIAELVECGRRIYRGMAGCVFLVSWLLGFFYLRNLELHMVSHSTVWIAWTILCLSQALTVWASVWTCLLQGVGYVGWDAIFGSLANGAMLVTQIVAVILGGGLIHLAFIAATCAMLQRGLTRTFARKRRPELFALRGAWNGRLVRGMIGISLRAWFTALGGILVQNTDGFFIATSEGAEHIPAFRAAFIVLLNIHMLGGIFASSSTVFISHLWQAGEIQEVQRIVQRNLRLSLSIVLCGCATVLTAGESLFNVWLGPSNYAGFAIVTIFVVMFILEQQTFVISTACRATEHETFGGLMMMGGILKLLFAYLLMPRFGLTGLAAGTLTAQLLTAYWFVPYHGLRRIGIGFRAYFTSVLAPCASVFVVALTLGFTVIGHLPKSGLGDWQKLTVACLVGGVMLLGAMWWLVLEANQRNRILALTSARLFGNKQSP